MISEFLKQTHKKSLVTILGCVLLIAGCGTGNRSAEGHTFDQLMDGVKADPAHYEVAQTCIENDKSVDSSIYYETLIRLTNTDNRQRSFSVWIDKEQFDKPSRGGPLVWQQPGETVEFNDSMGWKEDFPDGCPEYTFDVYLNPAEALVEGQTNVEPAEQISPDGHSVEALLDGIKADPEDYDLEQSCSVQISDSFTKDPLYQVDIDITNKHTRKRLFSVWIIDERLEGFPVRLRTDWVKPGESVQLEHSLGWTSLYPELDNVCPEHTVDVYISPVEATLGA